MQTRPFNFSGSLKEFRKTLAFAESVAKDIVALPMSPTPPPMLLTEENVVDESWDWTLPEEFQG